MQSPWTLLVSLWGVWTEKKEKKKNSLKVESYILFGRCCKGAADYDG